MKLSEPALGKCPTCGDQLLETRGRYPDKPRRTVCPTCNADLLDDLRQLLERKYEPTPEAKPPCL